MYEFKYTARYKDGHRIKHNWLVATYLTRIGVYLKMFFVAMDREVSGIAEKD